MHTIEPFYNWRDRYTAEDDKLSPFYGNTYNEFAFETKIYNYYIHPQWDSIDSEDLYVKLLYADYFDNFAIIELLGEWNDAIESDVVQLRNNLIDPLMKEGIYRFILIGENVFNFHGEFDDYYQEWYEEVTENEGWIVGVNFREHVIKEMEKFNIRLYINLNDPFSSLKWRPYTPDQLFSSVNKILGNRLKE